MRQVNYRGWQLVEYGNIRLKRLFLQHNRGKLNPSVKLLWRQRPPCERTLAVEFLKASPVQFQDLQTGNHGQAITVLPLVASIV